MENNVILFIVFISFVAFIIGYYLGLKRNVEQETRRVVDTFASDGFASFQLGVATERVYPKEMQLDKNFIKLVEANPPPSNFKRK